MIHAGWMDVATNQFLCLLHIEMELQMAVGGKHCVECVCGRSMPPMKLQCFVSAGRGCRPLLSWSKRPSQIAGCR